MRKKAKTGPGVPGEPEVSQTHLEQAAAPPPPVPPKMASPLQKDEELQEGDFLTGGADHSFVLTLPIADHPGSVFDEDRFRRLLSGSISLTGEEKRRIIESIPELGQFQIDELIRIFETESKKFHELLSNSPPSPPPRLVSPLQRDEELSESDFMTGGADHSFVLTMPIADHPGSVFDEDRFRRLLYGSISLSGVEKRRILEGVQIFSQSQIDELIRIFREEQQKFKELNLSGSGDDPLDADLIWLPERLEQAVRETKVRLFAIAEEE